MKVNIYTCRNFDRRWSYTYDFFFFFLEKISSFIASSTFTWQFLKRFLVSLVGQQINHLTCLKLWHDIFAITINLHLVKKKPNMLALNFGHFLISFYRAFLHKKVYTCIALVLVILLCFVYDIVKELNQSVLFCLRRVNFLKLYDFFRVYY